MSQYPQSNKPPLAGRVDLLAFDFDGVLTDNRVWVLESGIEAVLCNRSDGLAFDMMRSRGMPAVIVSTEHNNVVSKRAEKLRVPVLQGVAQKHQALEAYCNSINIKLAKVAFVGNDLNDLTVMRAVGFSIAVADAHPSVKAIANFVLSSRGGDGVAREVVEHLLGFRYSPGSDNDS
jgi:3-deoxy-D-manno-octulosonate 8-phosphate phosphatase (KDO 8-P phosphatase)